MSSDILQIISDDYEFGSDVKDGLKNWPDFYNSGFDYNILSILGPQSGGKSTLLNLLFNTKFTEMDTKARKQTTKGMWLAHDKASRSLIMDVEGTDSKERGDKHINFERKSALFSLALSEVLIVNMWANDVGRYAAAQYDTLKVVFDIHMRLFYAPGSPKTLIMFCLRDHQATPLEHLSSTLLDDIHNIWKDDVVKPASIADRPITDFFEFDFISLPNFVYEKDKFMSGVELLRKRFADKNSPDYVFQARFSKRIPADGIAGYASSLWDRIVNDKDVDIPSMKEMLASVRCEEILDEIISAIRKRQEEYMKVLKRGLVIQGLGDILFGIKDAAIKEFTEKAGLYYQPVFDQKKESIDTQIKQIIDNISEAQSSNFITSTGVELDKNLKKTIQLCFSEANADMWEVLEKKTSQLIAKSNPEVEEFGASMRVDRTTIDEWKADIKRKVVESVEASSLEAVTRLPQIMTRVFERFFKFDENQIPRKWDEDDDIPLLFTEARDKALVLLDLFGTMRMDRENPVEIMSETEKSATKNKFFLEIRPVYEEACNVKRQNLARNNIPFWVFFVVVLLGFNEFIYILNLLTNPKNLLITVVAVFVLGGVYMLHKLGMLGSAEQVVRAGLHETKKQMQMAIANIGEAARQDLNQKQQESRLTPKTVDSPKQPARRRMKAQERRSRIEKTQSVYQVDELGDLQKVSDSQLVEDVESIGCKEKTE